ncbi:MAG: cytochrome c biogenesis protein CcsA [Burkholderiaceae bacterium]
MILLYVAVALLYGLAAWHGARPARGRAAMLLLAVALALHAVTLVRAAITPAGIDLSFPQALSVVAWLTVLVTAATGLLRKLPGVANVVLPVAAVCALSPLAGGTPHRFAYAGETLAAVHIGVALVGYAFFVVAALQSLLLLGLERRVHRGAARAQGDGGLPLLTLEHLLFRLVLAGFVLLSLTLASGLVFSEQVFGRPLTFTHKNLFSLAGFAAFAVLLFGRWRYGWRGRRALLAIVGSTLLLLIGYLGTKFVSQVVLGR